MVERRTVSINANPVEVNTVRNAVGPEQFYRAIGYLSTWNMTYDVCGISIYADDLSMTTLYTRTTGEDRYVIAAIWNADSKSYSFHS